MGVGFWALAGSNPERIALVDESGTSHSAQRLLVACNKVANALRESGLERGDVVASVIPSGADLIVLMLAVRQIGLYLLPVNPRASLAEIQYLIADSAPQALFIRPDCLRADTADAVRRGNSTMMVELDVSLNPLERVLQFANGVSEEPPARRIAGDILSYTSGTTGLPKAVLRVRREVDIPPEEPFLPLLRWYSSSFGIDSSTPGSFLSACPLYFSGPMNYVTFALHFGRTVVLLPQWNARLALGSISAHRVTDTFLVPYQLSDLLREYQRVSGRYSIGTLRAIIHGSAPCSASLKEQALEVFGDIVYESYGATEVAGTVATPQDARTCPGTVGRATAPHEVRILDDDGKPCPPGVAGSVFMRLLAGQEFAYKGDAAATRAAQRDGFASVGDIGYLNESGLLFLTGRSSELINCSGEKISPTVIEDAAHRHSSVLDAAAFAEGDPDHGEVVRLAVRLPESNEAQTNETIRELLSLLKRTLRPCEVPRSVLIVDEIPRELSGKLRRRGLAQKLRSGQFREFNGTTAMAHGKKSPS
jgi:long-chain acyl-CoA synthetase